MVMVGLIFGVQRPRLIDGGRTDRVRFAGTVRQEVLLIEPQRGERLRLVGYLVVVMVGRTVTVHHAAVAVVVVRWNRWCVVGEQLHPRLDGSLLLLLLTDGGKMILVELKEAGGGCLLLTANTDATITCWWTSPPRWRRGSL